jgi:hypothetical protein
MAGIELCCANLHMGWGLIFEFYPERKRGVKSKNIKAQPMCKFAQLLHMGWAFIFEFYPERKWGVKSKNIKAHMHYFLIKALPKERWRHKVSIEYQDQLQFYH